METKSTANDSNARPKIFNLIILDASGSMGNIYNQALSGVNETIQTIKLAQEKNNELEQRITLASFSAGENYLNIIFDNVHADDARKITRSDYPLLGCTALYDAMGEMISRTQGEATHNDNVLVTIITDGMENSSVKWTGSGIKSLVGELRHMGWTFTYIGANQDVEKVAGDMGIRNSLSFSATEGGTIEMFAKERKSRIKYFGDMCYSMRSNHKLDKEEQADFFKEE